MSRSQEHHSKPFKASSIAMALHSPFCPQLLNTWASAPVALPSLNRITNHLLSNQPHPTGLLLPPDPVTPLAVAHPQDCGSLALSSSSSSDGSLSAIFLLLYMCLSNLFSCLQSPLLRTSNLFQKFCFCFSKCLLETTN